MSNLLNFSFILEDDDFVPLTKQIARDLCNYPYRTIGDLMKSMTDTDLAALNKIIDESVRFDDAATFNLLAIVEMLRFCEGLEGDISSERAASNVQALIAYVAAEGLARKGLVRLTYENMTFDEDADDLVFVTRLNRL